MMNAFRFIVIAAFLLPSFSATAAPQHLTVLHLNDIHGHLASGKEGGGAARIASIIKAVERENQAAGVQTIVLFGGDALSGTPISSEFEGAAEFDFFNLLGVDAMVLGNHEFDYGLPRLQALVHQASFPVISANTFWRGKAERLLQPSAVLRDGLTIGLFGLTTQETPTTTNPANVVDLAFTDPIREARGQVHALEREAPVRIALTHLGVKKDVELAKKVKGIIAVVGGHDHVAPKEYCRTIKKTPVCQTPANGQYVGRIDFEIDGKKAVYKGSQLIAAAAAVAPDPAVARLVAGYEARLGKKYDVVIGRASTDLRMKRGEFYVLGELVAEAARRSGRAEAAFVNSGGVRAPLLKGPIRVRDVAQVLPFPNRIVVLPMRGELLENVIAHCARRGGGSLLQVVGMSYRLDGEKPVDILVGGKPIDSQRVYRIATIDFLSMGGEGLTMLKKVPGQISTGILIRDAFIDYLKEKKVIP